MEPMIFLQLLFKNKLTVMTFRDLFGRFWEDAWDMFGGLLGRCLEHVWDICSEGRIVRGIYIAVGKAFRGKQHIRNNNKTNEM